MDLHQRPSCARMVQLVPGWCSSCQDGATRASCQMHATSMQPQTKLSSGVVLRSKHLHATTDMAVPEHPSNGRKLDVRMILDIRVFVTCLTTMTWSIPPSTCFKLSRKNQPFCTGRADPLRTVRSQRNGSTYFLSQLLIGTLGRSGPSPCTPKQGHPLACIEGPSRLALRSPKPATLALPARAGRDWTW